VPAEREELAERPMEFRILGPLQVRDAAGGLVRVPGAKERAAATRDRFGVPAAGAERQEADLAAQAAAAALAPEAFQAATAAGPALAPDQALRATLG
jgi:hypothetical protein